MKIWEFWKHRKEQKQFSGDDTKNHNAKESPDESSQEDEGFRFEREHHKPVIRSSICTGEQVAGFKDLRTGRFTEIMLVRDNEDLEEFTRKYGISREEIRREW